MTVFKGNLIDTYFNAALGAAAVAVVSTSQINNIADAATPGGGYATHARITCAHATQYAAALVADTGDAVIGIAGYSVLIPPLGTVIVPLSRLKRISIIASGASTIVSVEFGTYKP